jgi:thiamine-monophosphate kinase
VNEFQLIHEYFARQPVTRGDVALGIGDDAALLEPAPGRQLVVSTDTLNAGVHFPLDADPRTVGHKTLAVNLSDLAAMGATPAWFTLNISLPQVDANWLDGFCQGLYALARTHDAQLVGGDTTRGPLAVTATVLGQVPRGAALRRSGARVGDRIYVTGSLGDAALGLLQHTGKLNLPEAARAAVLERLHQPVPRVAQGMALRRLASACIDISDGLLADLGHILAASDVGACIELAALPLSPVYRAQLPQVGWQPALAQGDDYELCFTVPAAQVAAVETALSGFACGATCIGVVEATSGLRVVDPGGQPYFPGAQGYDHFQAN